jgi:ClpP class serine protease
MTWLLTDAIGSMLAERRASGHVFDAQAIAYIDASEAKNKPSTAGTSSIIPIEGVLTQKRDFFAAWFGGGNTLYPDITKAIVTGEADPLVSEHVLAVGTSPGGSIDGLFDTMAAIKAAKKPVRAIVRGMAASATFALVSQADEVIASNDVTQFGSVGIVSTFRVSENLVDVTSTKAPEKRPDVTTKEGIETARKPLDAIHDKFVEAIANGRGTTSANVNENYGRGAIVIASDAVKQGMIDSIGIANTQTQTTAKTGGEEVTGMKNLEELKAQHPALYAEAVAVGVAQERDKVQAHAIYGAASGDYEGALKNIKDGVELTATVRAEYETKGWNKRAVEARQEEQPPPLDGTVPSDSAADVQDQAMALIANDDDFDGDMYEDEEV